MKRIIRLYKHMLRFYEADGWTEDLVRSSLAKGEISWSQNSFGRAGYWHLRTRHDDPTYFDAERLSDLTHAVDDGGKLVEGDSKKWLIEIYGTDGIYRFGDDEGFYQRRGRIKP